jgi:hypothetical protein
MAGNDSGFAQREAGWLFLFRLMIMAGRRRAETVTNIGCLSGSLLELSRNWRGRGSHAQRSKGSS